VKSLPNRHRSELIWLGVLLVAALVLRVAALIHFRADLDADPDIYLSLAQGLADGRGYSVPGTEIPTAFRPPLYPMLLFLTGGAEHLLPRAGLQLLLSMLTLPLVWLCGYQLGLPWHSRLIAVAIMVFDPLLLRYVPFPMTETTCAFLIALLLVCLTREGSGSISLSFCTGLAFAACVLSRPTFWAFGMLYLVAWLGGSYWLGLKSSSPSQNTVAGAPVWKRVITCATAIAVCVAPWVIRNAIQMGSPILMTSHGGYTLLLGNNAAFYHEVVEQPIGTIWDGSHGPGQAAWYESVQQSQRDAGLSSELEKDKDLNRRAWQVIGEHPQLFFQACLLKFLWFWNVAPHAAATPLPGLVRSAVIAWYLVCWSCLLGGLGIVLNRIARRTSGVMGWLAPVIVVLSMTSAHLLYWSDARMRAPLMPAVALLAALAVSTSLGRLRPPFFSRNSGDRHDF
jgi:hypothetical protein